MELVFHKDNGLYITEFEVTSDFNVHLERSKGGKVTFYQRTTNGDYDNIESLSKNIDKIFDYDFQALVYPKTIKITSECEFDVATLTTDGEVTEIKSQSKEVEITSNGTTQIAPDAGFSYLNGVTVNVNVPTGGGGDIPSQPSVDYKDTLEYYKVPEGFDVTASSLLGTLYAKHIMHLDVMDTIAIGNFMNFIMLGDVTTKDVVAVAVDPNMPFALSMKVPESNIDAQMNSFNEAINFLAGQQGVSPETVLDYKSWERITKEEFWNLEA